MSLSIVQHVEALSFPSSGSPSLSVPTPVTRGNLLLLQMQTTSNVPVIPDDGRNIWIPIPTSPEAGGQGFLQTFWAVAESTRALTINILGINSGGTGNYYQAIPSTLANAGAQFVECSGNSLAGPYGTNTATGTSAAPAVNLAPANIGDLMFGFAIPTSGDTVTEGSGFTNLAGAGTSRSAIYKAATSTGTQSLSFVQSASAAWGVVGLIVGGPSAAHSISGSLGALGAGATVSFISQTSGFTQSVTADGSGNYSASLETDTYTIQPQLVGVEFSPSLIAGAHNTTNLTENFTSTAIPTALTFVQTISDPMSRSNESPLSDAGNWTKNGTPVPPWDTPFDLTSNEAVVNNVTPAKNYPGPFSGDAVSVWAGSPLPPSQFVEFQIDGLNPTAISHASFGLSFRSAMNNSSGYFYTGIPNGDGTITLSLFALASPVLPIQPTNLLAAPGLFSQRIAFWKLTVPFAGGDTFRAACPANTVYLYRNGTLVGTYADRATTGLFAGTLVIYAGANAATDVKISNVKAGTAYVSTSPVADVVNAGTVATTLASFAAPAFNLAAGDGVVCFVRWFRNSSQNVSSITDTAGNTYLQAGSTVVEGTTSLACYYCANAKANAANVVTLAMSAGAADVDFTVARVPKMATTSALDTLASATSTSAVSSLTGSITTANPGELVFVYANADNANNSAGQVNPPASMNVCGATPPLGGFCNTAYQVLPTAQTFSAICANASAKSCAMILVAFNLKAGDVYDSTIPFIGSVRILGSAPAGVTPAFLGTYKVLAAAPAGAANPYLGSVVVGSPAAGDSNPDLGQVVVVGSVPSGATDQFLGAIVEG